MNPRDFNSLAERLAKASGAAERRSAASRAYYAAHHVGREAIDRLGKDEGIDLRVPRSAAAHSVVINLLHHSGDRELDELSEVLRSLHSLRLRADYQLDERAEITSAETLAAVKMAARWIVDVDRILRAAGPRRHAVALAMHRNRSSC